MKWNYNDLRHTCSFELFRLSSAENKSESLHYARSVMYMFRLWDDTLHSTEFYSATSSMESFFLVIFGL